MTDFQQQLDALRDRVDEIERRLFSDGLQGSDEPNEELERLFRDIALGIPAWSRSLIAIREDIVNGKDESA